MGGGKTLEWYFFLCKNWYDSNTLSATITRAILPTTGEDGACAGAADDDVKLAIAAERAKALPIRMNGTFMPEGTFKHRFYNIKKKQTTFDIQMKFREKVVFYSFPFKYSSLSCTIELSSQDDEKYAFGFPLKY